MGKGGREKETEGGREGRIEEEREFAYYAWFV
jgi:hypothetical protein